MPKVPYSDNVLAPGPMGQVPMPSETDFAMAAATMHEQGRLFQVAGDVLPLSIAPNANTGPTNKSADYAVGKAQDSNVRPIPMNTLQDWMQRTTTRKR